MEFDIGNAHFESELILTRLEQTDSLEVPNGIFCEGYGTYFLASYKMFDRLTPFARYEFEQHDRNINVISTNLLAIGLNYSITDKVYLKNEVHLHNIGSAEGPGYEMYVGSIAVAF